MEPKKISFNTEEEVDRLFETSVYDFHKIVVDAALYNLTSSKQEIPIMEIIAKDTNTVFDIILEPEYMVETLEVNLPIMEEYEDYKRCQQIVSAIDFIKSKL